MGLWYGAISLWYYTSIVHAKRINNVKRGHQFGQGYVQNLQKEHSSKQLIFLRSLNSPWNIVHFLQKNAAKLSNATNSPNTSNNECPCNQHYQQGNPRIPFSDMPVTIIFFSLAIMLTMESAHLTWGLLWLSPSHQAVDSVHHKSQISTSSIHHYPYPGLQICDYISDILTKLKIHYIALHSLLFQHCH